MLLALPALLAQIGAQSPDLVAAISANQEEFLRILNEPVEDDEGMDEDDLIGRVVQVEVGVKDTGWPFIANVLPPRAKRKSAVKPRATTEDEG